MLLLIMVGQYKITKNHRTKLTFIDPGTITDDRCGEGQEGLMDERVSVPTGAKSSELMQPT